jgi:hypothetical protein
MEGEANMPDHTTITTPAEKPGLTDERKRELLEYWNKIASGPFVPEPTPMPEIVRKKVEEDIAEVPIAISAKARKMIERDRLFGYLYPDTVIVILELPGGPAVLAAGAEEFELFFQSMPRAMRDRVRVEHTGYWEEMP